MMENEIRNLVSHSKLIIVISNGSSGYDYKCVNSKYFVKANFYFKKSRGASAPRFISLA